MSQQGPISNFSIASRVSAGIGTQQLSDFNSNRNLYTPVYPQKEGVFRPYPSMPQMAGGPSSSPKTGASNPNKSSSLSDSGEIDAEALDEEGGDLDKIKELEKELKKKEAAQKAEEEKLKADQEKLDKEKEEINKSQKNEEEKKKSEEQLKVKQTELDERKKKFEEEQKVTTEQRKQLDEVISPPFAKTDEKGKVIKKDGDIQFLEKKSPELEKLKQLIRDKDPETIEKVRKALEQFNDYRKKYPIEEKSLDSIDPYSKLQRQASMSPIKQGANALNTLDFEEEDITSIA